MNRSVKDATIKAFHCPDLKSLKAHVMAFVSAHNLAKHLKALRWKTPFEAVCHAWTTAPDILELSPRHLTPGPNNPGSSRRRGQPRDRAPVGPQVRPEFHQPDPAQAACGR